MVKNENFPLNFHSFCFIVFSYFSRNEALIYDVCLLEASLNFLDSLDPGPTRHRFEGSHVRFVGQPVSRAEREKNGRAQKTDHYSPLSVATTGNSYSLCVS